MVADRKGNTGGSIWCLSLPEQGMIQCSNRSGMPVELLQPVVSTPPLLCEWRSPYVRRREVGDGCAHLRPHPGKLFPASIPARPFPRRSLYRHHSGCGRHMTTLMPNAILRCWFRSLRPASGDLFVRRIVLPLILDHRHLWISSLLGHRDFVAVMPGHSAEGSDTDHLR